MPELPDITIYMEALERRILGRPLQEVRLKSPFLLRSVEPPLAAVRGRSAQRLRRLGKRIAIGLEGDLWLVLHLMINGRLHWKESGAKLAGRYDLAAFDFSNGTLTLTEYGPKKRAALYVLRGDDALSAHDPGGLEVQGAGPEAFREALIRESHTLKRALTDSRLFSGIGNAYSDEILHRARLSPLAMTRKLTAQEIDRLHDATRATLTDWIARLRAEYGDAFPKKVTAFRDGMAVHGRYGKPCPDCGTAVQRIRFADNETNYCPRCQTGGQLLADRALSRLLRSDWPRTIEDLEQDGIQVAGRAAQAGRGPPGTGARRGAKGP